MPDPAAACVDRASRLAHESSWAGYDTAADRSGETVCHVEVAGQTATLRVAGGSLASSLLPALAARRSVPPAGPRTTVIRAWDSTTSGAPGPRSPWGPGDYLSRDEVRGSGADDVDVAYSIAARLLATWDRRAWRGAWWARDAGALPYWEPTAPLRYLFHWWLADAGSAMVHAAAVGRDHRGVLLVGPGGAGKSTAALACVEAGWRYVADDYCVLSGDGPAAAHSLYGVGKLAEESARRLPGLADAAVGRRPGDDKVVFDIAAARPAQMAATLALRAVVVPRLDSEGGPPVRLSRAAAARALAPSTLYQLPSPRPAALAVMARTLRRLPIFSVPLGPDRRRAVGALDEVLVLADRP